MRDHSTLHVSLSYHCVGVASELPIAARVVSHVIVIHTAADLRIFEMYDN